MFCHALCFLPLTLLREVQWQFFGSALKKWNGVTEVTPLP
jgi:hypothetical protein